MAKPQSSGCLISYNKEWRQDACLSHSRLILLGGMRYHSVQGVQSERAMRDACHLHGLCTQLSSPVNGNCFTGLQIQQRASNKLVGLCFNHMEVTVDGLFKTACVDGAMYRQADVVGKTLAHISLLPYLALFYQASAVYSRR